MFLPIYSQYPEVNVSQVYGTYRFAFVFYNWGTDDDNGSEHAIEGKK